MAVAQLVDLPAGRQGAVMYFVYVLISLKDKKFYTGLTNNIERRLKEHNHGSRSTPSTLKRGPFELVHVEIVYSLSDARISEKFFKTRYGREICREIIEWRS